MDSRPKNDLKPVGKRSQPARYAEVGNSDSCNGPKFHVRAHPEPKSDRLLGQLHRGM